MMKSPDFLHVDTISSYFQSILQIEWAWSEICMTAMVKLVENGRGDLGHGTLKSAVSQEWKDELS